MIRLDFLTLAGNLNLLAAFAHIAIIFGGPDWYRFFGAGEEMAQLAAQGSVEPIFITLFIALVLVIWALYAWSGAKKIPKLPLLKYALLIISSIYLLRGVAGLVAPFVSNHPQITQNTLTFWIVSSLICIAIGFVHIKGIINNWQQLSSST